LTSLYRKVAELHWRTHRCSLVLTWLSTESYMNFLVAETANVFVGNTSWFERQWWKIC